MNSARTEDRPETPRYVWGRLIALLVPVAVLGVALKLMRVFQFFPAAGIELTLKQVASDVAFGAAWVLLWVVACLFAHGLVRTLIFYGAHVATVAIGLFAVVNHEYTMRTGNPLNWAVFIGALQQGGELEALLGSQITPSATAMLIAVPVGAIVLPLVLGPLISRLLRGHRPAPRVRRFSVVGLLALLMASTWSAPTASAAFSLAPPVRLAITPVREANAYPESLASPVVTPTPETTRLVGTGDASPNLVIITLESQRSAATLQDVKQPVTPVLDALAQTSITPERGYSVLPHTSKALTAIHCGIAPTLDSNNSEADPDGIPAKCLPSLLKEQGYATSFFQSATENFERRRSTARNLGFRDFMSVDQMKSAGFHRANYFGYEDDIMLGPERTWLEKHGDQPFMLSMLTVTGHHNYALTGYPHIDFVDNPLLNKYLNSIHYQDAFVGRVIDMFKELGLYEDTVFVVVGDHGEGFGEHRIFQHDNTIYEEGLRIPFLIHDPRRSGEVIDGPANQLAVLPTLVDLLGFTLDSDAEYKPSLVSGNPQGPVVATCYARGKCTAIIDGDMKLIHHFNDRRDEVFNVATDPHEQHDLVEQTDGAWMSEMRDTALRWYIDAENSHAAFRDR